MQAIFQSFEQGSALFPPLFADYVADFSRLRPFFQYDPRDASAYVQRAAWLDAHFSGDRLAVAQELLAYNRALGADEAALHNASALGRPETLAVVTGQQAGLLGGPLYTLYKAVTAIQLAQRLSEELKRPVVPVFWIASEDHDFDEVRRAFLQDRRGRLRELSLPPSPGTRTSMGDLPIPRRLHSLLREVEEAMGERTRQRDLYVHAQASAAEAHSWSDWFARLLAGWLSRHGLVLLDPMRRELRKQLRDFFPSALLRRDGINRELAAAATRLRRRNYDPALDLETTHSHLFYYHEGQRLALFWDDGELVDREGIVRLKVGTASRLMHEEPWRFSTNVVLRPLAQDTLLPTVAVVAGPGEVAYLSQMRDVYPLFGLQMPVIYPRLSLTVVGPGVAERLTKHQVGVGAFLTGDPREIMQVKLRELDAVGIEQGFRTLRQKLSEAYGETVSALAAISPELTTIGQRNLERVLAQTRYLEKKAWYHHRRAHRDLVRDFECLQVALRPRGQLQERVYAVLPVLAEYGLDLIRILLRASPLNGHQILLLQEVPSRRPSSAPRPAFL